MTKGLFFIASFFFLLNNYANSQGINNLWLMGYNGGINIDFISGIPNIYSHQRPINFTITNASICNAQGNLLFYTNGMCIADNTDSIMQNGDSLVPGPYLNAYYTSGGPLIQGVIILPFPGSDSLYYLIHEQINGWPSSADITELLLTVVDMSQNNGKGAVIQKSDTILSTNLVLGQITAVKHANGRDWWIVCHEYNSDIFHTLLLTPQGISGVFSQHIGQNMQTGSQVVFSKNGSRFARYDATEDLDILDFDRCTGLFSNLTHISINDSSFTGGVAFSSNSQFLYVFSANYVYQFDANATNIAATQTTIAVYDSFMSPFPASFFLCQLAPDGKIYGNAPNGVDVLHVINYPDSSGNLCDIVQHGIQLPFTNSLTLPTPPNYFLGPVIGSNCDSLPHVGIYEPEKHNFHFSAMPNPLSDGLLRITYLLPQNNSGWFKLYDALGREVYRLSLPQWSTLQQFRLPHLTEGLYHALIISNDQMVSKKIVLMSE